MTRARRVLVAALAGVVVGLAGCAPREPIARAIRARGGPLAGIVREVEAEVWFGVPGTWRWRTAFGAPDLYAWTIYTVAEPNDVIFDGTTVRTYVAGRLVSNEAAATAPLRTHARFTAVMYLDALLLPGVAVAPLPPADVPEGAVEGVAAVFADDGSRYRLGFDADGRLVALEGPLALPPVGTGLMLARFADFRRQGGRLLAYATEYTFRGLALAKERTLAACPAPSGLERDAFRSPQTLPACPAS